MSGAGPQERDRRQRVRREVLGGRRGELARGLPDAAVVVAEHGDARPREVVRQHQERLVSEHGLVPILCPGSGHQDRRGEGAPASRDRQRACQRHAGRAPDRDLQRVVGERRRRVLGAVGRGARRLRIRARPAQHEGDARPPCVNVPFSVAPSRLSVAVYAIPIRSTAKRSSPPDTVTSLAGMPVAPWSGESSVPEKPPSSAVVRCRTSRRPAPPVSRTPSQVPTKAPGLTVCCAPAPRGATRPLMETAVVRASVSVDERKGCSAGWG